MYQHHSPAYYNREQRFNDRFPTAIVAVLGVVQMLTTFAIFAMELAHNLISLKFTNLFVGFWASIPFTILWISMFAAVCCCRRRSCATHAVVQNIIGLLFAGVLIGINIVFIRRPNDCFFSQGVCNDLSRRQYVSLSLECVFDSTSSNCGNTRISLIKGQLAAGVIMATACVLYLIIYTAVALRASKTNRQQIPPPPTDAVMRPVYQQQPPPPPPSTLGYHRQPYIVSANPYQPSAPVMMPGYPSAPPMVSGFNNMNYLPPNQYPTLYPQIPNDRF